MRREREPRDWIDTFAAELTFAVMTAVGFGLLVSVVLVRLFGGEG